MSGGESRVWALWRAHPFAVDAALAVLLFGTTCALGVVYRPAGVRPFDAMAFVLTALITFPLMLRRTVPVTMLVVSSLAYAVYLWLGYVPDLAFWCPALALYSVAALRPLSVTLGAALVCAAVLFQSGMVSPEGSFGIAFAQAVVIPVVVLVLGRVGWQLGERNRQLAETTEQLRREQRLSAERAVTEERLRIARELHDVVAHHMSVISMQAGLAAFVFDSDRGTAREAVATIGATSRETLEELRRLLNLLRDNDSVDGTEPLPAPGLGELDTLVRRVRAMGVDVTLDVSGDVESLPSGQQLAVYRVVQEALTNVFKHAGACHAEVTVARRRGELRVVIANDAPATRRSADTHEGGHGLDGMRERARLYGGTLTAQAGQDGGFTVQLLLPAP